MSPLAHLDEAPIRCPCEAAEQRSDLCQRGSDDVAGAAEMQSPVPALFAAFSPAVWQQQWDLIRSVGANA